ncbi:MAG: methionyl-tRNA formyltransferase [Bacteroidales bacterium]|nr:methionyl-tRNA formyltransferase [Bacteroidales bacterium]
MSNHSPRIVYMGSPGFAVRPLQVLMESGCNVVGVITAPDRRAGRGKKIRHSAIKEYLLQQDKHIPILQPENLKDPAFLGELGTLKPDLQVVVAFRMLPEVVWSIPSMGTFNLHASLLPQYRGAAPINHVIINGESETGVTTFFIDEQIDTGKILLQERTAIGADETAGKLHDRPMELGAGLVLETVLQISRDQLDAKSQDQYLDSGSGLKRAPKIFKDNCRIDWNLSGKELYNLIRGLSPSPGAFTILEREKGEPLLCKIFRATFETTTHRDTPGTISTDGKRSLEVAVKNGVIHIHSIQQEGKRKMDIKDFLAGFSLMNGVYRFS